MGLTQSPNNGAEGRGMRRAVALGVLTAATLALAFTSAAGASEGFTATGSMAGERDQGVAIRLASGKVLVLGGERSLFAGLSFPADAELYDPASGQFAPTGAMSSARWGSPSKAVLLRDGKVLVAGGDAGLGTLASGHGDLYDPESGQFTLTHGSMITPRRYATATLLPSGKVLFAGGSNASNQKLDSAELYDPATGDFTATAGAPTIARWNATAELLADGKVLIAGGRNGSNGWEASAELYDPATDHFTATGSLSHDRDAAMSTALGDGTVLVAGGRGAGGYPADGEIYDPATGNFAVTANAMTTSRFYGTATRLVNGKVLIAGGRDGSYSSLASTSIYDPVTRSFADGPMMGITRYAPVAALLESGKVLVAGGLDGATGSLADALLFDPGSFDLTVARSGSGSGTVSSAPAGISCASDCSESYVDGRVVTLTAHAATGSVFSGWSGAGCSGIESCVVTMSEARSVTAGFSAVAVDPPVDTPVPPIPTVRPARPSPAWSSVKRSKVVTATIHPAAGVSYSIVGKRGSKAKRGSCKKVTVKRAKLVSCKVTLASGSWTVVVTPIKAAASGAPATKRFRF
ncbi:unannotated protein [freshwater metagenome]|uniref:Unannotated protein n=1 Tax=freshwater metagenome TaxID=449393 RepID=A0A6J5ZS71_9ZZZZ